MLKTYIKNIIKAFLSIRSDEYAFKGNNVYCPCCKKSFITFLPSGVVKRANALCPNCFSLERHRLIWMFLNKELKLFNTGKKIRILHVAPEIVFFKEFSTNSSVEYFPIAKMEEDYPDTYPLGTKNNDLTALTYPDKTFDFVFCSHVLEHIPNDGLAMREICRVLKPKGIALLQVPLDKSSLITREDLSITDPQERERLYGQNDHVRMYGMDYKDRLEKNGFVVEVNNYREKFTIEEKFKFGLMIEEDLYVCRTK